MISKKVSVRLNDLELPIAYFETGNPKGMPIVYIHGWGCSKSDFEGASRNVRLMQYRLIAFDFPGCGESSYPSQSLDLGDLAAITIRVVEALNASPCVLVGHSIGGAIGVRCATQFPEHVVGLVSVVGNLTASDCVITRTVAEANPEIFLKEGFEEWYTNFEQRSPHPGFRRYGKTLRERTNPRAYIDYAKSAVEQCERGDLLGHFVSLEIPKLFVYCEHNKPSINYIEKLLALANNQVSVKGVPDSEHFPCYENPVALYDIISSFLEAEGLVKTRQRRV